MELIQSGNNKNMAQGQADGKNCHVRRKPRVNGELDWEHPVAVAGLAALDCWAVMLLTEGDIGTATRDAIFGIRHEQNVDGRAIDLAKQKIQTLDGAARLEGLTVGKVVKSLGELYVVAGLVYHPRAGNYSAYGSEDPLQTDDSRMAHRRSVEVERLRKAADWMGKKMKTDFGVSPAMRHSRDRLLKAAYEELVWKVGIAIRARNRISS